MTRWGAAAAPARASRRTMTGETPRRLSCLLSRSRRSNPEPELGAADVRMRSASATCIPHTTHRCAPGPWDTSRLHPATPSPPLRHTPMHLRELCLPLTVSSCQSHQLHLIYKGGGG